MNIFLTGDIQVGKSTILHQWMEANPQLRIGGFRTVAGSKDSAGSDSVHMIPATGEVRLTRENRIMKRRGRHPGCGIIRFVETFNTLGVSLLEEAADCDLILMDEIGVCEDHALPFHKAVLECLDGKIPVLGVVRDKPGILTDAVRRHPGTRLVIVTAENRTEILEQLLGCFRPK